MVPVKFTGDVLWERIERAVEIVKDRLRRVTRALNAAEIPYAVIGGNAVQFWVAQVDKSVVRNTRDDYSQSRAICRVSLKSLSRLVFCIATLQPCAFS